MRGGSGSSCFVKGVLTFFQRVLKDKVNQYERAESDRIVIRGSFIFLLDWLKCVKKTLDKLSVTVDLDCKNLPTSRSCSNDFRLYQKAPQPMWENCFLLGQFYFLLICDIEPPRHLLTCKWRGSF